MEREEESATLSLTVFVPAEKGEEALNCMSPRESLKAILLCVCVVSVLYV